MLVERVFQQHFNFLAGLEVAVKFVVLGSIVGVFQVLLLCIASKLNSDLQAGIWFGSVAPSPIITLPQSPMA